MENQEIAIIQNDKIIKVMPREQYDQAVIQAHQAKALSSPVKVETKVETVTTEPYTPLTEAAHKNLVVPMQTFAFMIASVFIVLICGVIIYKHKIGRKPNWALLDFIKTISLIGIFLIFVFFVLPK